MVKADHIAEAVEDYFGNNIKVITTSRRKTAVIARRIAYYLAFDMTHMSQTDMALFFDADSSCIYRGIKHINENYEKYEKDINTIRNQVLYSATLITV